MFLALDESFEGDYCSIGCVCLPSDKLPELEHRASQYRLKERLWGELKYSKITNTYLQKYIGFLEVVFSFEQLTFHSWTYKKPSAEEIRDFYLNEAGTVMYRQAYLLLRSIIRKNINSGYRGSYYILPDTSERSIREYATTQKLLASDSNINPKPSIDFCSEGNSAVCSALQAADICTGAVQSLYSSAASSKDCVKSIVDSLQTINSGVPIDNSPTRLPALADYRLHHCFYRNPS